MNHKAIHVYRGKYIESTHNVHIAVVHASGDLIAYYGDPHRLTFARSSMKPFQATPVVESGALEKYGLTDRELALCCASHIGEPFHRLGVEDILEKIGLEEKHLQCGTHVPNHAESYRKLIKEGGKLTPLFSNCSGKHAGMLAGVTKQKMDLHSYRNKTHPYQQQIIQLMADISEYEQTKIGLSVDGCGVPVHRLPLANVALSFSRLASPEHWKNGEDVRKKALKQVRDAMVSHPDMVAGTKQFDTDLMEAYQARIVAKGGAEGVQCFGDTESGIGVAIKVADGNARGASVVAMEVLQQLKIGDARIWDQLANYHEASVLNTREETIGKIVPSFQLKHL